MFILNTTFAINVAWKVIQAFLKPHTKKKISLTSKSTDKELFELAHGSQVEEKFGGEAENVESFWPPIMPSNNYDHDEDNLVSDKEYCDIIKQNLDLRRRPDLADDSCSVSENISDLSPCCLINSLVKRY
jgi:hypothetical protein